jgi:hypothetical protein
MKVVLNKCYGGFGLSPLAIVHYLKLKGLPCFFYKQTKYKYDGGVDLYEKSSFEDIKDEMFVPFTFTKDFGAAIKKWPTKDEGYWYYGDLERSDPLLVQTIEEIGEKEASAKLAELKVIEIPDDVEWELDDYDGIESIHEVHRSW